MEFSTDSIELTVAEIGDPWDPWRWGGDTRWNPGNYWHLVELGGICRETRQTQMRSLNRLIIFLQKVVN